MITGVLRARTVRPSCYQSHKTNDILSVLSTLSDADLIARLKGLALRARLAPKLDAPTVIRRVPAPPIESTPTPPATAEPTPSAALPAPAVAVPPSADAVARAAVTSLSPDRYKIQLTIGGDTLEKLRCARDMLSHAIPSGDDAAVLDRALEVLLVELAKKKFAVGRKPRPSAGCKDEGDIPSAVKRVVYVRCRGRCTFVGADGHRCEERRFIQFHHLDARALGGKATADRITLRCRAHNDYEGRLLFGRRRRNGGAGAVGEDRYAYGTSNLLRNKLGSTDRAPGLSPPPPPACSRTASRAMCSRT